MSYLPLLQELDDWQGRTGCAACCMGPFDISVADALLVRDPVAALPDAERAAVRRRAAERLFADRDLRDFETTIAGAILLEGATAGGGATHHQGTP